MTVDHGRTPLAAGSARTLGESLRQTRVSAGVSIEQVEADLRIKSKYIEAIEDGDVAALPSRAYTDGFLRNYATYLGHDPAETVNRFAGENGLPGTAASKSKTTPIKIKHKAASPLSGAGYQAPQRSAARSFGRGVASLWPLVLFAGLGFGGYTGYVAARDAGLVPPQLGGIAKSTTEEAKPAEPTKSLAAAPEKPASETASAANEPPAEKPDATAAAPVTETPTAEQVAEAEPETVGDAAPTGGARPDRLSYARAGATPYWQAKPPSVEPSDGPVSEIEPETAGLMRSESDREDDSPASRWSGNAEADTPPSAVDASRIAAEARAALAATLGLESAPFDTIAPGTAAEDTASGSVTPDTAGQQVAALGAPLLIDTTPDSGVDSSSDPGQSDLPGIGPIVTQDLAPAEPAQAPRRFALIAQADAWVQVLDANGAVAYTGIMSAGEAYNIPNQEGLRLKTGNAGGLLIEVDGQRFGPLGSSGAVMRNVALSPGAVRASFTLSRTATLSQQ